ncbi:MAG: ABC transporter substrate-binding protein [Candidatus Aenigmarchaeota archaeon]|nr:ABC transporter substrate-binding protein [Candidatus Aenigmarchaeota archaeon]
MAKKNNTLMYGAISLAVLIIAVIGIGFYGGNTTTSETEDVTVMMPFIAIPIWTPFYCAIDQGYYADEGLNVEMTYSPKGSMGPIEQVGTNNIQLGYASGCSIITAKSKDIPIIAVYQIEHTNMFNILAKKGSGITEPKDLTGKKIAVPGIGSPPYLSAKAILYKSGVDLDSVTFVPVGAGIIPTLLENKADAIGGHITEKSILDNMKIESNIMYAKNYNADLVSNVVITNEKTLKNNPELIRKFVRATDRGLRYAVDNPEKAIDIYIKLNPEAAKKRDISLAIWKLFAKDSIQPKIYSLGQFNKNQWTMTQDTLFDLGVITKKTPISEMYTDEFVPK